MADFDIIDVDKFQMPISEFDLSELRTLNIDSSIHQAIQIMQVENMGSMVISDGDDVVGIMTERDLLHKFFEREDLNIDSPISDIMTREPLVFTKENTITDCIRLMVRRDFRHIPIIGDDGKSKYMVSINDILAFIMECFPNDISKHGTIFEWTRNEVQAHGESFVFDNSKDMKGKISGNIFLTPLEKLLYRAAVKVEQNLSVKKVLKKVREAGSGAAIVTQYETSVKGIVTERDFLLKVYHKKDFDQDATQIGDLMTPEPHCLFTGHTLAHAINNMNYCHYRNIILVDEEKFPLGIITLHDILTFLNERILSVQD